jgi:hypothetical protein
MRRFLLTAGLLAALGAAPAGAQTVKYLNALPAATAVAGTNAVPICQNSVSFTGAINNGTVGQAGTVLTVTAPSGGTLAVNDVISGAGVTAGTIITAQTGGTTGGAGTYTVNNSQSIAAEAMTTTGCGAGNALAAATLAQLNTWFQSQISATSPITFGSGVIAFANQSANTVLAGPSSGSAAAPAFRLLAPADMPATTVNYQTGSYTIAAGDLDHVVVLAASGPTANATFTIPAPTTAGFGAGTVYMVENLNATYTLDLVASGGTLQGLATNPLGANGWALLVSDGTNWLVMER